MNSAANETITTATAREISHRVWYGYDEAELAYVANETWWTRPINKSVAAMNAACADAEHASGAAAHRRYQLTDARFDVKEALRRKANSTLARAKAATGAHAIALHMATQRLLATLGEYSAGWKQYA